MSGTAAAPGAAPPGSAKNVVPGQRTPASGSVAATQAVAARTRGAVDRARSALEGSPGRLRIAAIACVLACLAFAALADWSLQSRASALSQARAHAEQLVRIQQIASDLVAADSEFTNGYLTFGQDSTGQLTGFDTAVADASRLLAQAAQAEPADAAELARVNDALTQYTARVAAARANNRQGFQVGIGYLRQANQLLQSTATPNLLPTLGDLITANSQRVDTAFSDSRAATWLLVLAVVLGLGVLVLAQVGLALRTHRVFNVPLVAATGAVLLAALAGGAAMAAAQSKADDVKNTSYAATLALANARISAYTGKSYESIALIYIGTGGDYPTAQKTYQTELATATAKLDVAKGKGADAGRTELGRWSAANDALYAQAQDDWTGAATKASSTAAGGVNALFSAFDAATGPALQRQATAVSDGLTAYHGLLTVIGWAALVLGIVAAGASWLGVSLRLEEYR